MTAPLVPDDLWAVIVPPLPKEPPTPKAGRPRVPDRICPAAILFLAGSGIPWEVPSPAA